MSRLYDIDRTIERRAGEIASSHSDWPCRQGCDDCCRRLASPPCISEAEWRRIRAALDRLPADAAAAARGRIAASARAERPVTCPLLDTASGSCLVYDARPVACRAYGFYAERQYVLGCHRIEGMAEAAPDVVWGNHVALEDELAALGARAELREWLSLLP